MARSLAESFFLKTGKSIDKWEQYLGIYERELSRYIGEGRSVALLEVGVQNGGSLELWGTYLPPGSTVVGLDIDPKVGELVFADENVKAYVVDGTKADAVQDILGDRSFDVIIDDGSHTSSDIIAAFQALFDRLRPGGLYIVEDLHCSYYTTHEGGFRQPSTSIEWLKRLVEAVNYDHIDRSGVDEAELILLSEMNKAVAGISFYDSVAVIEKFSVEKKQPFRRLLSGTGGAVVPNPDWIFLHPRESLQSMLLGGAAARSISADLLLLVEASRTENVLVKAQLAAAKADAEVRSRAAEGSARDAAAQIAEMETAARVSEAEVRNLQDEIRHLKERYSVQANRLDSEMQLSAKLRDADAARERLLADLALARRRLVARTQEMKAADDLLDGCNITPSFSLSTRVRAFTAQQINVTRSVIDVWDLARRDDIRVSGLTASLEIMERRLIGALAIMDELRSHVIDGSRSRARRGARWLRRLTGRGAAGVSADVSRVDAAIASIVRLDEADLLALAGHGVLDTAFYLESNPDLAEAGVDPVLHYFKEGAAEDRQPHVHFDAAWYVAQNPDAAAAGLNPLVHYALHGALENRPTVPGAEKEQRAITVVLRISGLFDDSYYRTRYPDAVTPDGDALEHFVETGVHEGRDPSPEFSTAAYLADNPDVAAAGTNPLLHYALHGRREGRMVRPPADLPEVGANSALETPVAELIRASGLFDPDWYTLNYADVPPEAEPAWLHFVDHGLSEGRQPNVGFDPIWYTTRYPDTGASSEALLHYIRYGAVEGRQPSEVFDPAWYLETYPDVRSHASGALAHYVRFGQAEGRLPRCPNTATSVAAEASDLFDPDWYLSQYADAPRDPVAAWRHFLDHGVTEGRRPNAYFDPVWYTTRYPDVGGPASAFSHYVQYGGAEGREPSVDFEASWYLRSYPDVAATLGNPLAHYLKSGRAEGRQIRHVQTSREATLDRLIARYRDAGEVQAETLLEMKKDRLHSILERFDPYSPINVYIDEAKRNDPVVYVILPSIRIEHATGGPNTAFILGCELAARDVPVVFLSTSVDTDDDLGPIKSHLETIAGVDVAALPIRFATAHDNSQSLGIGENDLFLATAWWTAQAAHSAASLCRHKSIFYLIQDYEPNFYGASSVYTLAQASYGLAHRPIINTSLLRDHLSNERVGRFKDPDFGAAALVFEPAIDIELFHPELKSDTGVRTLLFYARPTKAERNLFSNGVAALRIAVARGVFDNDEWEFIGMGEVFDPVSLGKGHVLTPAPWVGMEDYAQLMRRADLLLSLMLSPHPSYPPLEMAACGGVVVTTTYGSKTADRLAAISPLIIAVEPQIETLGDGLCAAVALVRGRKASERSGITSFPKTWAESLIGVINSVSGEIRDLWKSIDRGPHLKPAVTIIRDHDEIPNSPDYYIASARHRGSLYGPVPRTTSFTLITTVYDTDPSFVSDLARTVFAQDPSVDYDWMILDNGSSVAETCDLLTELARHPRVRLERTPKNLGIVGGMKWCLDNARGDYILPVDSDDLLFPDCLRTIAAICEAAGRPAILYTDEDKTEGLYPRDPYLKPDWDPVLFFHSCYVAHLTVIDRKAALTLGCYSDPAAEGSHDWDTFTRFFNAGYSPFHIPEVLYTWRMHDASTAGNYRSKPYIYASHHAVLKRFLDARGRGDLYQIRLAPLFDGTPDYQFVRKNDAAQMGTFAPGAVHDLELYPIMTRAELLRAVRAIPSHTSLIHLHDGLCDADGDASAAEASALLDLFPDAVLVGGRVHDGRVLLEGGYIFGYGGVVGCPDEGRALGDPGYFAQTWKPRSVGAVSARHCYVRRDFLSVAAAELPDEVEVSMLGPWLGAVARETGGRVVYSPYVSARGREPAVCPTDAAAALFCRRFPAIGNDVTGYARYLDKSGLHPFIPNRQLTASRLPDYAAFLDAELASRGREWPVGAGGRPTISILTTVYINTLASLFEETARAVRRQTYRPLEWLVLAHGPIPDALDAALSRLALEGLVTVLREENNLGIQGGLRRCLEAASGDFVLSLDADDLLTRDAIQILTAAAARKPSVTILYSDEDLLIEGEPSHPFYRPDFDPVLLTGTSFIWHAILFRRDVGLRIGAYTSPAAEYAQDWDVLVRFHAAGHRPVHVPSILYHWRQHASSLSNSGTLFEGSVRSVKGVLGELRDALPIADLLQIADYPIHLGQASFYLERVPVDAPPVQVVRISRSPSEVAVAFDVPNARWSDTQGASFKMIEDALSDGAEDLVLLIGDSVTAIDVKGYWQALKHIEMHLSCIAVGGPLLDIRSRILRGPLVAVRGRLVDEGVGRLVSDTGPFSLASQAHTVTGMGPDCILIRREALRDLVGSRPADLPLGAFALLLACRADQHGKIVVYEPLFAAGARGERLVGDSPELLDLRSRSGGFIEAVPSIGRGTSGFIGASEVHR